MKRKLVSLISMLLLLAICSPLAAAGVSPLSGTKVAFLDSDFENWSEHDRIGDDIPVSSWIDPRVKPWAVLLCIHGLSLHSQNYEAFGLRMANIGIPTYAIDVRGFGSWQNTKERANSQVDFKMALEDIHGALEALRAAHPELPIVLVGESMGGALALQAAAQNQDLVDGLICSVPANKRTNQKMNTAKVAVGMLTGPNRQMKTGQSVVSAATKNPELADIWMTDEMARLRLSAKELLAFAIFTSKNAASASQIENMPVLFLQGARDQLINPKGTFELYQKLATPQRTMHIVNAEHLLLEYHQFHDQLIDFISGWIQRNAVPAAMARVQKEDAKVAPEALEKAAAHLKIAEGFLKLHDDKAAEEHLLQVIALARGSHFAQDAEIILCTLPDADIAPNAEVQTPLSQDELKFISHQEALDSTKPSVVMFYADWIEGCKQVDEALHAALAQYGSKVNFVRLDADLPENQAIVKRYAVRPIPTVLYMTGDNCVVGYTFGYPGQNVINAKIRSLIVNQKR
ncbi:MAG TPA: alpha/beta fold hydrolase [Candidatus Obscuribacterales bacterium]